MNQKIQPLWAKLEKNRLDLLQSLEKRDPSVLNQKPSPEAWSVNQNIMHLIEAETASLTYMRKKLSFDTHLPQAGLKSHWRRFVLKLAFALPIKVKAPANLENFPDDLNFEDLKNRWSALRTEYVTFLEALPDNLVTAELWRHQLAGKMNMAQMIGFFNDHVQRHRGQIERTIDKIT